MKPAPLDVTVIGGGPAGAAAARLLADRGHSVQVLAKPADDARTLAESLPPSCRKLFDLIGVTADVEAAGFLRSTGNTVWWGEQGPRAVRFAGGGAGWQVRRSDLDRLLLGSAARAGAAVQTDSVVRQVGLAPPSRPAGAAESSLRYLAGGETRSLAARFVLDCSGRAGVVARRGFRRHAAGRTTLALTAVWSRRGGWGLDDESHTLVESYGDGWAWSVPVTTEQRYFTLMVDPRVTRLERGGPLAPCYHAELAKTAALGPLTAGATLDAGPWGCDASVYDAKAYTAPGMLLVGDAGSFIDPLSSYGVKKALASGWLAAVAVHTALTEPALAGVALDLFDEREREMHAALERQSAEFFAEAAGRHDHPFWTDRAEAGMPEAAPLAPSEPAVDALRRDPGVLAAFETLRRAPSLRLRRATGSASSAAPPSPPVGSSSKTGSSSRGGRTPTPTGASDSCVTSTSSASWSWPRSTGRSPICTRPTTASAPRPRCRTSWASCRCSSPRARCSRPATRPRRESEAARGSATLPADLPHPPTCRHARPPSRTSGADRFRHRPARPTARRSAEWPRTGT